MHWADNNVDTLVNHMTHPRCQGPGSQQVTQRLQSTDQSSHYSATRVGIFALAWAGHLARPARDKQTERRTVIAVNLRLMHASSQYRLGLNIDAR